MPTNTGVFDRSDFADDTAHEQVVFCRDERSGLKAIIAIHSTALGPSLGGTRFYPYPDEGAALTDVLRLSRGMTYKAAIAGLGLGGGKSVIIGDPKRVKTPICLRHTEDSSKASAAATSPPVMWARPPRTWTSSAAGPSTSPRRPCARRLG